MSSRSREKLGPRNGRPAKRRRMQRHADSSEYINAPIDYSFTEPTAQLLSRLLPDPGSSRLAWPSTLPDLFFNPESRLTWSMSRDTTVQPPRWQYGFRLVPPSSYIGPHDMNLTLSSADLGALLGLDQFVREKLGDRGEPWLNEWFSRQSKESMDLIFGLVRAMDRRRFVNESARGYRESLQDDIEMMKEMLRIKEQSLRDFDAKHERDGRGMEEEEAWFDAELAKLDESIEEDMRREEAGGSAGPAGPAPAMRPKREGGGRVRTRAQARKELRRVDQMIAHCDEDELLPPEYSWDDSDNHPGRRSSRAPPLNGRPPSAESLVTSSGFYRRKPEYEDQRDTHPNLPDRQKIRCDCVQPADGGLTTACCSLDCSCSKWGAGCTADCGCIAPTDASKCGNSFTNRRGPLTRYWYTEKLFGADAEACVLDPTDGYRKPIYPSVCFSTFLRNRLRDVKNFNNPKALRIAEIAIDEEFLDDLATTHCMDPDSDPDRCNETYFDWNMRWTRAGMLTGREAFQPKLKLGQELLRLVASEGPGAPRRPEWFFSFCQMKWVYDECCGMHCTGTPKCAGCRQWCCGTCGVCVCEHEESCSQCTSGRGSERYDHVKLDR